MSSKIETFGWSTAITLPLHRGLWKSGEDIINFLWCCMGKVTMGGSSGRVRGVRTPPFRPKVLFFVKGCNF
jgi:hypothetical protein